MGAYEKLGILETYLKLVYARFDKCFTMSIQKYFSIYDQILNEYTLNVSNKGTCDIMNLTRSLKYERQFPLLIDTEVSITKYFTNLHFNF